MSFFRKLRRKFEKSRPRRKQTPKIEKEKPSSIRRKSFSEVVFGRRPQKNIRVCFTNRGLNKVVKSIRSLSETTPDKKTIVNIANILSDLTISKEEPTGFVSIPEFIGLDYVGYIIDKERLDKRTGKWIRVDEYKIIGVKSNNFKDSRVAYNNCYRYRIKSIIKATIAITKKSFETFEFAQNIRRFERDRIKEQLRIKQDVISNISRITNQGLTSKSSKGIKRTSFDLFDGLKIRSDQRKTESIRVPIKDPRDKIRNFRRMKNLRLRDLDIVRGTISKSGLQKEINRNLRRFIEQQVEYISFYYESFSSKAWQYEDISENIPPPPPESIKITPSSLKEEICLAWLKPANSQRDIKFFRVWRRLKVGERWQSLIVLPESQNFFLDINVRFNRKYIYALSCIDAHNIESFLSTQIQAELNPNYIAEQTEKDLKWISGSGTKPSEINIVLKKFRDIEKPIIAKKNFAISPTNEMNEANKKLLIRVTSLDTHEKKEFNITLKNVNIADDNP